MGIGPAAEGRRGPQEMTIRYFAQCAGQTVQLGSIRHDGSIYTSAKHFTGSCPACGERHQVERAIERKSSPSNHKCDARCETARGFKCECSCGGRNHGKAA